ncbi:MAG: hypothetical protein ACW99H_10785 [Candidatus Thorarchaeota archaeon]|jgi:hypothetical protein
MNGEKVDEKVKTIWSPLRMAVLVAIWSLVTPFRIQITHTSRSSILHIWAGAWGYGRVVPWTDSSLVFDLLYTWFMFPYYSIGLVIGYLVWRWAQEGNLTKMQYIERVLLLQLAHVIFVLLLFPCPYSFGSVIICVPTPTTGIFALPFVTRVVKEISSPWQGN